MLTIRPLRRARTSSTTRRVARMVVRSETSMTKRHVSSTETWNSLARSRAARERASEFHVSVEETWRFVIEVSLLTTMRATRLVVEDVRARRSGRIVNMSTESAVYGDVGFVDYAAAKMGVVGFTRSLARELAPFHVNVNVVCPGAIRTRAHDRLPKEVIDKVRTSVPMGYVAEPEDVAGVVAFLASDDARYITGQSILIDGGRWMI